MEEIVSKNKGKKEFKQTKDLMNIARNNGWNQTEIAAKCRTQQSIVSAWFKGSKKATENQVRPLLELFGYQLRKNTFRLYQKINEERGIDFFKVEGRIIFNYAFYEKNVIENFNIFESRGRREPEKYNEVERVIIHFQGNNKFALIYQTRLLDSTNKKLEKGHPSYKDVLWSTKITIIEKIDNLINEALSYAKPISKKVEMRFLLIEALLNNGFEVSNIKVYSASW